MRKVVVNEWVSLDGVLQAPGGADEDTSGDFQHGGWHLPYFDEPSRRWVVEGLSAAGGFIFGRRTYEILSSYWPDASEAEQVIAEPLNSKPKYVASSTLSEPLSWQNAALLGSDVVGAVSDLRGQAGGDLHVLGSSRLLHTLIAADLVDDYRLMVDPIALGAGKRLFPENGPLQRFSLVESQVTTTGAILATYARA